MLSHRFWKAGTILRLGSSSWIDVEAQGGSEDLEPWGAERDGPNTSACVSHFQRGGWWGL